MASCAPDRVPQVFDFDGSAVRVMVIDDEPWWVAADVARVLDIGRTQEATRHLDDDEKGGCLVDTPLGGPQQMTVVSESGLYSLVLRSRKPEAKRFKRWVTHDVLPALRRTGSYSVTPALDPAQDHEAALVMLAQVSTRALEEFRGRKAAEARVAELAPPAMAWASLASTTADYDVGTAAKILSRDPGIEVGRQRLFRTLLERGLAYLEQDGRRSVYRPYQRHVDAGRFVLRMGGTWQHPKTGETEAGSPQLRVTAKGLQYLHQLLRGTGAVDPS